MGKRKVILKDRGRNGTSNNRNDGNTPPPSPNPSEVSDSEDKSDNCQRKDNSLDDSLVSAGLKYYFQVILVPVVTGLMVFNVCYIVSDLIGDHHGDDKQPIPEPVRFVIPVTQQASLKEPYAVDYQLIMKIRKENMKKYDFDYSLTGVDRRSNLSLQEYRDVYDGKWPVIITDVVPTWPAFNWTAKYLVENYGKERVAMKAVDKALSNAAGLALPLELFYSHIEEAYPTRWTYVEDELFLTKHPELKKQIGKTIYLEPDYFKLFPSDVQPWDAMLLWGTKHSRSSLHMDPYNWTGTNAVIKGQKHWKLFLPGQDHLLYIKKNQLSGFPLATYKYNSPADSYQLDMDAFPQVEKADTLEFDLLPGELLLIPSGWFHQAYNTEETLAISSQVMNENNFRIGLEEILKVGNVAREDLPNNIDSLSPEEQVAKVMSLLPQRILDHGRAITEDAIRQVQYVSESAPKPFE